MTWNNKIYLFDFQKRILVLLDERVELSGFASGVLVWLNNASQICQITQIDALKKK